MSLPPAVPVVCWKCGAAHLNQKRIYRCLTCSLAVCFEDLYANGPETPIAHKDEEAGICGPVVLIGHATSGG